MDNKETLTPESTYEIELYEVLEDGSDYIYYYENFLKYKYAQPAFDNLKIVIEEGLYGKKNLTLIFRNMNKEIEDPVNCTVNFIDSKIC
ncbi:MAG: hypothetical protein LBT51_06265 [Fusobacteriaceae bacterium]|jgi:hypothetical protein|nr:hypothetical protein [Fusobacteriaceae bacterium]